MSDLTDLPDWLWTLLDALDEYEHDHPLLYAYETNAEGGLEYVRTACFGAFLTEREAWPPREVTDAAYFRRHVLREHRCPVIESDETDST